MTHGEAYELGYEILYWFKFNNGKPGDPLAVATLKHRSVDIKDFYSMDSIHSYLDYCHRHHIDSRKNKWNKVWMDLIKL